MDKVTFSVGIRETFIYTRGWDNLDKWRFLPGQARFLSSRRIWRDEDIQGTYRASYALDKDLRRFSTKALRRAFTDTLTVDCRCEHDGCGHVVEVVTDVYRPSRRTLSVVVHWLRHG